MEGPELSIWAVETFGALWKRIPPRARQTLLSLHEEVLRLREEVGELRERLRQTSVNSSKPPSSDALWQRTGRLKKLASHRTAGAQRGHRGAWRPLLPGDAVDEIVDHAPDVCAHCGSSLSDAQEAETALQRHQICDLPVIKARVTEHRFHARSCVRCGQVTRAPRPSELTRSAFGPRLQAEVVHLVANCHLSRRGLVTYAAESWGVPISLGSVHHIEQTVSRALEAPYREALEAVKAAPVRHVDETGWVHNNALGWLWTMGSAGATAYMIAAGRGRNAFQALAGDALEHGVFVSDRYRVYQVVDVERRGLCHAHLRRDFIRLAELSGFAGIIGQGLRLQHALLFELLHRFRAGELSRTVFQERLESLKARMRRLLEVGREASERRLSAVCADLLRHWPALWTFSVVPGVEPTNNAAERALRKAVMWRKRSFGTRSVGGRRFVERLLTITQTCRQNGRDVLTFLIDSLRAAALGRPAPKLVVPIADG